MHLDLLDFFRGLHSWRKFYDLLDDLPYWGHYKTALSMDEVWAQRVLDMEDAGIEDFTPRGSEDEEIDSLFYTPEVSRLDLIADRILSVRGAVIATAGEGQEEPRFTPMQRPTTALERERERRSRSVVEQVMAQVFGGGLAFEDKKFSDQ